MPASPSILPSWIQSKARAWAASILGSEGQRCCAVSSTALLVSGLGQREMFFCSRHLFIPLQWSQFGREPELRVSRLALDTEQQDRTDKPLWQ